MNLNDDDYPSPFKCWVSLLLLPVTIVVGVARLATSPAYRRVYRARQLRHRDVRERAGMPTDTGSATVDPDSGAEPAPKARP